MQTLSPFLPECSSCFHPIEEKSLVCTHLLRAKRMEEAKPEAPIAQNTPLRTRSIKPQNRQQAIVPAQQILAPTAASINVMRGSAAVSFPIRSTYPHQRFSFWSYLCCMTDDAL
jgi:hypothetical protein